MNREKAMIDECQQIWDTGPGFAYNGGPDYMAQVLQVLMLIGRELAAINDTLEKEGQ